MPSSGLGSLTGGQQDQALATGSTVQLNDQTSAKVMVHTPGAGRVSDRISDVNSIFGALETGQKIVMSAENGDEISATVFLMSGGGKGATGKSKSKYKSELGNRVFVRLS